MTVIDCPICSGKASDRDAELKSDHEKYSYLSDVSDYGSDSYARGREKVHVCRNCGARITKDGKLFDSKGSEINMFGDTQDYG